MEDNREYAAETPVRRPPWNKGKLVGAKPPLRPSHVWSIRTKLQMGGLKRDLALFNLAIDSKLRGCDVVAVRVDDVAPNGYALDRATVRQKKTGRPVRFELTDQTRQAIDEYLRLTGRKPGELLFPGSRDASRGLTTRQYARLVGEWVASIGIDASKFGTHSLRRTKAVLIYRRTGNLRAVQLLLGHTKIESTVRYLGIEVDDAIEIAEKDRHLTCMGRVRRLCLALSDELSRYKLIGAASTAEIPPKADTPLAVFDKTAPAHFDVCICIRTTGVVSRMAEIAGEGEAHNPPILRAGVTLAWWRRVLCSRRADGTYEANPASARMPAMTVATHVSPNLFLNETLSEADLAGSRLCLAAMTTLQQIGEQGGISLTKSGAFNRKFVVWAVDALRWPRYTAEELYVVNKVLDEGDVPPLCYLHELLLAAKLIRHAKGHAVMTKAGKAHLGQHGRLQVELFQTFFTRFDFAAHERWPIEVPEANTFHFLGVIHNRLADWVSFPEFAGWCLPIFALPAQRGTPEEDAMFYLASRLVRPLDWLGLLEEKEVRRFGPINAIQLRKTALFDKFFRFEAVRNDIGSGRRH